MTQWLRHTFSSSMRSSQLNRSRQHHRSYTLSSQMLYITMLLLMMTLNVHCMRLWPFGLSGDLPKIPDTVTNDISTNQAVQEALEAEMRLFCEPGGKGIVSQTVANQKLFLDGLMVALLASRNNRAALVQDYLYPKEGRYGVDHNHSINCVYLMITSVCAPDGFTPAAIYHWIKVEKSDVNIVDPIKDHYNGNVWIISNDAVYTVVVKYFEWQVNKLNNKGVYRELALSYRKFRRNTFKPDTNLKDRFMLQVLLLSTVLKQFKADRHKHGGGDGIGGGGGGGEQAVTPESAGKKSSTVDSRWPWEKYPKITKYGLGFAFLVGIVSAAWWLYPDTTLPPTTKIYPTMPPTEPSSVIPLWITITVGLIILSLLLYFLPKWYKKATRNGRPKRSPYKSPKKRRSRQSTEQQHNQGNGDDEGSGTPSLSQSANDQTSSALTSSLFQSSTDGQQSSAYSRTSGQDSRHDQKRRNTKRRGGGEGGKGRKESKRQRKPSGGGRDKRKRTTSPRGSRGDKQQSQDRGSGPSSSRSQGASTPSSISNRKSKGPQVALALPSPSVSLQQTQQQQKPRDMGTSVAIPLGPPPSPARPQLNLKADVARARAASPEKSHSSSIQPPTPPPKQSPRKK